jgi:hypothetical protein
VTKRRPWPETLGEELQVEGLDAWKSVGARLAVLDRERFRRFLLMAEACVALYESDDPDAVLATRTHLLDETFDA